MATGLALKIVVCQVLQANAANYFISHRTQERCDWKHQFLLLGVIVPLGYVARFLSEVVLLHVVRLPVMVLLITSSAVYALLIAVTVWRFPQVVGMNRTQLNQSWQWFRARLQLSRA